MDSLIDNSLHTRGDRGSNSSDCLRFISGVGTICITVLIVRLHSKSQGRAGGKIDEERNLIIIAELLAARDSRKILDKETVQEPELVVKDYAGYTLVGTVTRGGQARAYLSSPSLI